MATYTGVADANGDFTVSFGTDAYTGGQKVIVTAEKDSATKSIELHAPSEVVGGGVIKFSGTLDNFPNNIGVVTLTQISGAIGQYCFASNNNNDSIWRKATGLVFENQATSIGAYAFMEWTLAKTITLPNTLTSIETFAFNGWVSALGLTIPNSVLTIGVGCFQFWQAAKSLVVGNGVAAITDNCFYGWSQCLTADFGSGVRSFGANSCASWSSCDQIIIRATTPPSMFLSAFSGLKSTCIFKVPAASVAAYQAAESWSTFASRIQAI